MASDKRQGILIESGPPDIWYYEKRLIEKGMKFVAGVDEVGRGSLAGPVFAAAVILPTDCDISGITDSKRLTSVKRETLFESIDKVAPAIGFGSVGPSEIDEINILQATLKAMRLAIEALPIRPQYVLIDGNHVVPVDIPQLVIPKGDLRSISVAAASILAKVKRDKLMCDYEKEFPKFGFSIHKGYGTARHLTELRKNGPTKIHRRSFRGVL